LNPRLFWRLTRARQQEKDLTYPSLRAQRGSGVLPSAALSGRPGLQFPAHRLKALGGITVILGVSTNIKYLPPPISHPSLLLDPAKLLGTRAFLYL